METSLFALEKFRANSGCGFRSVSARDFGAPNILGIAAQLPYDESTDDHGNPLAPKARPGARQLTHGAA
jgi:hypothetical protein